MTGLSAATTFGLRDRGRIGVGLKADITVFNPDTIIDRARTTTPPNWPRAWCMSSSTARWRGPSKPRPPCVMADFCLVPVLPKRLDRHRIEPRVAGSMKHSIQYFRSCSSLLVAVPGAVDAEVPAWAYALNPATAPPATTR